MRNPTPHVSSRYGAPMGRGWNLDHEMAQYVLEMYKADPPKTDQERAHRHAAAGVIYPADRPKVSLRKVRINSGGYDAGGAYWGLGQQLWSASSDDGSVDLWFRARSRDAARAHVLAEFPTARFYR